MVKAPCRAHGDRIQTTTCPVRHHWFTEVLCATPKLILRHNLSHSIDRGVCSEPNAATDKKKSSVASFAFLTIPFTIILYQRQTRINSLGVEICGHFFFVDIFFGGAIGTLHLILHKRPEGGKHISHFRRAFSRTIIGLYATHTHTHIYTAHIYLYVSTHSDKTLFGATSENPDGIGWALGWDKVDSAVGLGLYIL